MSLPPEQKPYHLGLISGHSFVWTNGENNKGPRQIVEALRGKLGIRVQTRIIAPQFDDGSGKLIETVTTQETKGVFGTNFPGVSTIIDKDSE